MKGFTKGKGKGKKFIPTGNRNKSSLSKKDLTDRKNSSVGYAFGQMQKVNSHDIPISPPPNAPKCSRCGSGQNFFDNRTECRKCGAVVRNKKELELGKDFHIYRIFSYDEDGRSEIAVIKAKNIDDVEKYVKETYLTPEGQENVNIDGDGDEFSVLTLVDDPEEEIRNEIEGSINNMSVSELREKADELGISYDAPDFHEDDDGITKERLQRIEENMVKELREEILDARVEEELDMIDVNSYGYQIDRDDDTKQEFKTIYGGNDFVDLIDPTKSGKSTDEVVGLLTSQQALARALEDSAKQRIKDAEDKGIVPRSKESINDRPSGTLLRDAMAKAERENNSWMKQVTGAMKGGKLTSAEKNLLASYLD